MELVDITWYGHANFRLIDKVSGNTVYYIDPYNFPTSTKLSPADIVFITHAHGDHCSPSDVDRIIKRDTVLVMPSDCLEKFQVANEKIGVAPKHAYEVKKLHFETVAAYNTHPQRLQSHPKESKWVGYIFTINNKKVYHAGDTDFTSEMKDLRKMGLEIAMLPIGGLHTMDVDEAITAANTIQAKITIPMHYKSLLGEAAVDAERKFSEGVTKSHVVLLEEVA